MSSDDKQLHEFKRELASLIGKHVGGLDEASISDVLEEYSDTLQGKSRLIKERSEVTDDSETSTRRSSVTSLRENSSVYFQPDTDASEAGTTSAQTAKTRKIPGAAMLKTVASQPPPEPKPSAPTGPSVFDELRLKNAHPKKRWNLSETSVADVLVEVSKIEGAGLLEMEAGKRKAELVFNHGEIQDVRILPISQKRTLIGLLQEGGQLDPRHATRAREYAHNYGITEAEALLQFPNVIPRSEVLAGVRSRTRHFAHKLIDVQLDTAAYFRLEELPSALQIASVSVLSVLFAQVRAKHTGSDDGPRKKTEARLSGMLLSRKPNPDINVNRLNLQLHERPILDQILAKPHDLEAAVRRSPLQREDTIAILAGLDACGLLEVAPPGLGDSRSSSWVEDLEDAVKRIGAMETRLDREDGFEIFELHWATHDAEIERRYKELNDRFTELNQPMGLEREDRQRLRQIRARLREVYTTLSNTRERQRYRRDNIPQAVQYKTAKSLEMLADEAMHRKSYQIALDYYQRLLELEPKHVKAGRLLPTLLVRASNT